MPPLKCIPLVALAVWTGGGFLFWWWFITRTATGARWLRVVEDRTRRDWKDEVWPCLVWAITIPLLALAALLALVLR
jgi:hypothetical protein